MIYSSVSSILLVLALVSTAPAQEIFDPTEALKDSIWVLRRAGKYAEALEIAEQLLSAVQADTAARVWEVADAERLVSTLDYATRMPEDYRHNLAVADSLRGMIQEYWNQGLYAEGEAAAEEELLIRRDVLGDDHSEAVRPLTDLAAFLHAQGKYQPAESLLVEAVAAQTWLLGREHPEVARNLNHLAYVVQEQGRLEEAQSLLAESLEIDKTTLGEEHVAVASIMTGLAFVLDAQGKHAEALQLYREALAMQRKILGQEHPDVAINMSNIASALNSQGRYGEAVIFLREALVMLRKILGEEHPYLAVAIQNLASVLNSQGRYAEAEPFHREALAMRRRLLGQDHPDVATSLSALGNTLDGQGRYEEAGMLYREALSIRRKALGPEHRTVVSTSHNLASALNHQGKHAEAEVLYRETLAKFREILGARHPDVGTCLNNLAYSLYLQGRYEEAEPLYKKAFTMKRQLIGQEHPAVALYLKNLGSLLSAQGRHEEAEPILREAAMVHDVARIRAGTGLARATFLASPYLRLAATSANLGRGDDAWSAAEQGLGRVLTDLLLAANKRPLAPNEFAQEDSLKKELGTLESELASYQEAAARDTGDDTGRRVTPTRNKLLEVEASWARFQQQMAEKYPITEGRAYTLDRVQAMLPESAALIGWLDVKVKKDEYDSWGYVVRSSPPVYWAQTAAPRDNDDEDTPFARARSFRDAIVQAPSFLEFSRADAHDLWRERFKPLADALEGVEELIVIPSGAMVGVPVETLVDDEGEFVGDRYSVSYIPSATIYTWLTEKARSTASEGRALLVGDPPFAEEHLAAMDRDEMVVATAELNWDEDVLREAVAGSPDALSCLRRLAGSRREVAGIAEALPRATVLLGPDASEQELVRLAEAGALKEYDTIHFATHALMDDERPENSALVLSLVGLPDPLEASISGTRIYDGLLRAKEIVREWELDADLVTLSACETGLGKEVLGEGYIGFSHAFLQAGARSLIVSLWPVKDEATSLLMQRFYENRSGTYHDERLGRIGAPMSKAEALQEAKRWLRTYADEHGKRPFDHPYYWSAFILIGDRG